MNTLRKHLAHIRLAFLTVTLFASAILSPPHAHAAKMLASMTPDSLDQSGFTMKVQTNKDGMISFTLTRDLSKARSFATDSELQIRRSATLQLLNTSGPVATCSIEADRKENLVTYRFTIAKDFISQSSFTLADIEDYKDQKRPKYIGGGEIYEFKLAPFASH
jgi:hypothetical protein